VEEAEKVSDSSWELLIPTIRKSGSEIWIGFNAKNPTDATYRRFVQNAGDDVLVRKVNWRENPFFPVELNKERLKLLAADPEAYEHIWEGGFDTRHSGAVYAKWLTALHEKGQVSENVKWDPAFPVFTAWDLGYDDSTAIWFFQLGFGEVFIIDYYENNNEGIGHYCEMLNERGAETASGWGKYTYGTHYVPHDAANKVMAAGGRSILEQAWRDYGVRMDVVPATSQMNSIEALRKTLPKCWFNKKACSDGIDALMQYSFQYDENLQTFKSVPIHNWASHAADAAEIMGRMWQTKTMTVAEIEKKKKVEKFHRLRSAMKMGSSDPYRIKPVRKK
jgi:phage terminase large subunit